MKILGIDLYKGHPIKLKIDETSDNPCVNIVGFSGGKDSTAMSLRLKEIYPNKPFNYVFTPTGDELPDMLNHIKICESLLDEKIIYLTAPDGKGGRLTLNKLIKSFNALPNFRQRWCTRMLKIKPTEAFMKRIIVNIEAILYVGLRADEEERKGLFWKGKTLFPMREWGWKKSEVKKYLEKRKINIPRRTDCARCYHQKLIEWKVLSENHPEIYENACLQEDKTKHTFRSPGRDKWPSSLRELLKEFKTGRKLRGEISYRKRIEKGQGSCRVCNL